MKYKVIATTHGFLGRMWEEGEIVEIDPKDNPPKFFVPVEKVKEEVKVPHRTEPKEVTPGSQREVEGGFAHALKKEKLPRVLTTDKLDNKTQKEVKVKKKRPRKAKKGAGSAKK